MIFFRCTLDSAYEWVQKRNASIAPNFHFMGQLTDYEKMLGLNSNRVGVSRQAVNFDVHFFCIFKLKKKEENSPESRILAETAV